MDIMEKLIAKGVDIDLEYYDNKEGKTPMMEAIISGIVGILSSDNSNRLL